MYELKNKGDYLFKPVVIGIPVNNNLSKVDVVKGVGVGFWFTAATDSDPDFVIETETEDDAIQCMKGFKRTLQKSKMKVVNKKEK